MNDTQRILNLHKADNGPFPVADLELRFCILLPRDYEERRALYLSEGKTIEQCLHETLPGGIYDRVLIAMMERRASLFRRLKG